MACGSWGRRFTSALSSQESAIRDIAQDAITMVGPAITCICTFILTEVAKIAKRLAARLRDATCCPTHLPATARRSPSAWCGRPLAGESMAPRRWPSPRSTCRSRRRWSRRVRWPTCWRGTGTSQRWWSSRTPPAASAAKRSADGLGRDRIGARAVLAGHPDHPVALDHAGALAGGKRAQQPLDALLRAAAESAEPLGFEKSDPRLVEQAVEQPVGGQRRVDRK